MANSDKKTIDFKSIQENLTGTAREVWLAGLGALASVEKEGNKLFDNLVERGQELEKKGEDKINATYDDVKSSIKGEIKKVEGRFENTINKVSESFEENVSSVLEKVGVPTFGEVKDLISKVETLTKKVDDLSKKVDTKATAPKTAEAPAPKAPAKTADKPAAK
jgi:poly(hydroxyalkanoate) granule-associated protein